MISSSIQAVTPVLFDGLFNAKKEGLEEIHRIVQQCKITSLSVAAIKQEVSEMVDNLLFPVEFTGKLVVQPLRNGVEVRIPTSKVNVGEFPDNSRVPYDMRIEPKDGWITIQITTTEREIHLNVGSHLTMRRVSDDKIERIIKTLPFFPFFIRNIAREQLTRTIYDPTIAYKEFSFFTKPEEGEKVLIKASIDEPTSEAQRKTRATAKKDLELNLKNEYYARSAFNWGKMMMFPDLGADSSLINKLFRQKMVPSDENGRVNWKGIDN